MILTRYTYLYDSQPTNHGTEREKHPPQTSHPIEILIVHAYERVYAPKLAFSTVLINTSDNASTHSRTYVLVYLITYTRTDESDTVLRNLLTRVQGFIRA